MGLKEAVAERDRDDITPWEFEQMLQENARIYSAEYKNMPVKPGLRSVCFAGNLLYGALKYGQALQLIKDILAQLPDDAVLMDMGGSALRLKPAFTSEGQGCHHDAYCMIFASKEWTPVEEGGIIPELKLDLNRR